MLVHLGVLLLLLFTFLRYPPKNAADFPPAPDQIVELLEVPDVYSQGEAVRRGDLPDALTIDHAESAPSDVDEPLPSQPGADAADNGTAGEPSPTVTSALPSPSQQAVRPKGPTKEQLLAQQQRQEAVARAKAQKNADEATRRAFGGKGSGQAGSPDGNATAGATTGIPGNGLRGRTLESFTRVSATLTGQITISVTVDASGNVTNAAYDASASSGPVAADLSMRQACLQSSRQCRFSVLEGSPLQRGSITWRFK